MELIIAEKPSVARTIAATLGATENKDGYMQGHGFLVSWCIGHLVELALPEAYKAEYARWKYKDLPIIPDKWQYSVMKETEKQFNVLKNLMNDDHVGGIVCATDAGREGELIFRLVYEKAGCRKPVRRLWISSMEESAIREGFSNMKNMAAYDNLYQAALCRAQADWLIGMNATRLYSLLYGPTLHIGRVMTPTLFMLAEREDTIDHFEPETFYTVKLDIGGNMIASSDRISDLNKARGIQERCNRSEAVIQSIEHKQKTDGKEFHSVKKPFSVRESNDSKPFTIHEKTKKANPGFVSRSVSGRSRTLFRGDFVSSGGREILFCVRMRFTRRGPRPYFCASNFCCFMSFRAFSRFSFATASSGAKMSRCLHWSSACMYLSPAMLFSMAWCMMSVQRFMTSSGSSTLRFGMLRTFSASWYCPLAASIFA